MCTCKYGLQVGTSGPLGFPVPNSLSPQSFTLKGWLASWDIAIYRFPWIWAEWKEGCMVGYKWVCRTGTIAHVLFFFFCETVPFTVVKIWCFSTDLSPQMLPSDGVDRDSGGESGHRPKIIFSAWETFLAFVPIHLQCPNPLCLTVSYFVMFRQIRPSINEQA